MQILNISFVSMRVAGWLFYIGPTTKRAGVRVWANNKLISIKFSLIEVNLIKSSTQRALSGYALAVRWENLTERSAGSLRLQLA